MKPTNTSRLPESALVIAPRVKYEGELRFGHEKVGCPGCNQDVWVSTNRMRLLDGTGRSLLCRPCAVE